MKPVELSSEGCGVNVCISVAFDSSTDSPKDLSRKIQDNYILLSNVQTGSSAVYQCNASNEFGYVLANAFLNVLGELLLYSLPHGGTD